MVSPGPVGRLSNKETRPANVGYAALFDTVKFSHSLFTPRCCGAHIFPCLRVGAARFLLIVYDGVQLEETKLKEVAS